MKKTLTLLLLVLAITTSLIAGTMAYYTVTLDNLVQGEVVAKEFIFVEKEGKQTLSFSDKIAPGETVEWPFTVQNHKDGLVTETDMYYRLTFVVGATDGKQAIAPLAVTVNGQTVTLKDDGTGTFITDGNFLLQSPDNQQSDDHRIVLTWPHGDNDSAYAGNNFGTTVTVNAVAQQVPFDEVEPETPEEPDDPDDDDESGDDIEEKLIKVLYEIIKQPNSGHHNQFKYSITIENNSEFDISNWQLFFKLENDILVGGVGTQIWNATISKEDEIYTIKEPSKAYNVTIESEKTLSFGGLGNSANSLTVDDLKDLKLTGTVTENSNTHTITFETDQIKYTRLP
jgi:hypothetical protein